MSPWEMKPGQIVGYKPFGNLWRARVTALDPDGKPYLGQIPIVDEAGDPITYEDPPSFVAPVVDYPNYFLVEDVKGAPTDPWLAARLDHEDTGVAWKKFAERIGLREPYYQALGAVMEKWASEGNRGAFLDDLLVLLHASWRAGSAGENEEIARLLRKRCDDRGMICMAHCTHSDDIKAIRDRRFS